MKNNRYTGGFTLIELLVVVLIIGILSSIALPQYQKAVEKSRASEAMSYADSWLKGQQLYHMANGEDFATDWTSMDINLPTSLKHFFIWDDANEVTGPWVILVPKKSSFGQYYLWAGITWDNETQRYLIFRYCSNNEKGCKSLTNGAVCSHGGGDGDVPWCYSD